MTEYAKLVISVDSRPVSKADADLKKLNATAGKTEKSTDGLGSAFRRLAGPLAAVFSARQIAQASESYVNLTNRLKLVTDGTTDLIAAQEAVFSLAQNARQPLDATAELYQRIATNADELGLSASGVAAVVDTVNKSLAVSGTTAQAASGALVQLGQAFASGSLRGDELNAVLESAPALAKALSDGLGVSVGQLRELGKEGKLSAQNVIDALLKQGTAIDDQFSKIQATGGQAFTVLGNSLTRVVGEIDTATGASASLANGILDLSKLIDSGALTGPIIQSFATWSTTFDAMAADVDSLALDFDVLGEHGGDAASFIGTAFRDMPANIQAAVKIATVEILSLFDRTVAYAKYAGNAVKAAFTDATQAQASAQLETELRALNELRNDSLSTALAERDAILQAGSAARAKFEDERKAREQAKAEREEQIKLLREQASARTSPLSSGSGTDSKETERAAKRLSTLYSTNEQQLERQIALFGVATESARVRYEIENGELSKLNKAQQERLQGLAVELDRLEQIKKNREEAEATKEFTAALEDQLRARQNAIDIEVKAIGLGDKQADQLREINQLEFEYAKRLEDLARAQGTSNALTEQAYAARVEALRAAMEEEVRIVEEGARRKDEAESDWLKGAAGALQDYVNEANNGAAQMRDAVKNALQESEDAVFNFAKTGKLSFKDLVNSINDDLLRIGSKQIVASAAEGLSGALGGLFSSGSGAGMAGLFSSFAGLFDSGGNIPSGQFGIVGERGPEIVRGPVSVTGREDTAKMLGNRTNNTSVQLVFPNASTSKDVREAAATGARKITGILKSTARFN
ncbi:Putative Phage tail tape measure protein [Pseudomonas marincola]|uniref:Putative Phage tail tape measure protein n=1 Tax=Pseudomonas marincola TaxID=437900 RepID=A0A653E682_9PSED|nr:phage tail tape measure protein [Pseudomonas marincola]CAE6906927.1 Putative Phage tail tape measure protein [Pseudomonas marincola]